MGMERYEFFVRRTNNTLVYDPGWSRDNKTGSWRSQRPVVDFEKCSRCKLCWLYCPDSCIELATFAIDYTYCKGCGICAQECPVDAIAMVREAEE